MNPDTNSSTRRPRRQSLFFKLFMVLVGAVLLTYLAFGGFYRSYWNTDPQPRSFPGLVYLLGQVTDEIGTPPDTIAARRLAKNLGVAIGIDGPDYHWSSESFSGSIPAQLAGESDSIPMMLREGRIWSMFKRNGYDFVYGSRRRAATEGLSTDWKALIPVLLLCYLLAWLMLQRLLQPLRDLEKGVEAVAHGNLDVRVSEKGRDELAGLAKSFNAMALNLKERERARDQLLLDVSHELRSPLTRMRVALEMAEPGPVVESVQEEIGALGKMVAEILETERLNSPAGGLKRKPVDLTQLMLEKISRFEGRPPGIVWKGGQLPSVPMDVERMRMVLRNVLDNALKYGREAVRPVEVSLRREDGFGVIEVRDFGPGIPEEDRRLVFEPFYRVDRSRSRTPGYGLGLPLCKRIVEAHGGSISLLGGPGEGTRVIIRLPLA